MKNKEIMIGIPTPRFIRQGFTLVELLVVISIIAVLLSILMPSLNKVRGQATSVACLNNLRQLSLGFMMYVQSNNNKGPQSLFGYYESGYIPWTEQILPYMGDSKYRSNPEKYMQKVMFCPATIPPVYSTGYSPGLPKNRWRYDAESSTQSHMKGRQIEGSYGINVYVGGGKYDDYVGSTWKEYTMSYRTTIPGKADIPVFGDCTWSESAPRDTDPAPRRNFSDSTTPNDFWQICMYRYYMNRHNKKINFSFSDGHCASVPLTNLWNLQWNKGFKKIANVPIPAKK